MNYELKLCLGVFFLSVVRNRKINLLWGVLPCCVCVVNQAHLNPRLYFSSWNVLVCSLSRINLRGCFQKTVRKHIFCVCSLELACVPWFLLSVVDQDEAMRVLFILMAFIVVLHKYNITKAGIN